MSTALVEGRTYLTHTLVKRIRTLLGNRLHFDARELLRGGATALILKLAGTACLYLLVYLINRFYGAAVYGSYAFFVSTLKMMGVVAVFGIDIFSLRHISEMITKDEWGSIRQMTRHSYRAILLMGAMVTVTAAAAAVWAAPILQVPVWFILLLAGMVLPFAFNNFHLQCFRSEKNILLFAGINFLLIPLLSILVIGFFGYVEPAWSPADYWVPLLTHSGVILSVALLGGLLWNGTLRRQRKWHQQFTDKVVSGSVASMWRFGFPFLLASTSVFFASWVVQFGLKIWSGDVEVAIYDVSFRIGLLTILPLMAVNAIAAPKFSGFYGKGDLVGLQRTAQYATLATIVISCSIALFIYCFPEFLLDVFGEAYQGAVPVLLTITIAHVVNAVAGPNGNILLMSDNQELFKNIVLFSSVITAILSVFLVRWYGAWGAAMTYTVFSSLNNGLQIYFVHQRLGIHTFPTKIFRRLFR